MDKKPRKRHPKWQYTDTGSGRLEDEFPGVRKFLEIEEMHTLAWSPDPEPGRGRATQVHVVYRLKGMPESVFVQRFKTVDAWMPSSASWPNTAGMYGEARILYELARPLLPDLRPGPV